MENKGEDKVLKLPLDEVLAERFQAVKENTGMQSNRSVLAFLIGKEYDKIQDSRHRKLFVRPEIHDRLEKKAAVQGQSVDVFVQELFEDEIRKAEEGAEHAEN